MPFRKLILLSFCFLHSFRSLPLRSSCLILGSVIALVLCCLGASIALPIPCPVGTYQDELGQSSCKNCTAGFYCDSMALSSVSHFCPPGSYCPEGTLFATQFLCPRGTIGNFSNLRSVSECPPCPPGVYCPNPGMTSFTNTSSCASGFFCTGAAWTDSPQDGVTGNVCPPGSYCPTQTSSPKPCQLGEYQPSPGAQTSCAPCPGGYYCAALNLSIPTGLCKAGYYCSKGLLQAKQNQKELKRTETSR